VEDSLGERRAQVALLGLASNVAIHAERNRRFCSSESGVTDENRQHILATVRNGAVWILSTRQDEGMRNKRPKKELLDATRASVKREMARPRMAKSARIMERDLAKVRIPERTSTTLPGKVAKIIPPQGLKQPEKAQIVVDGAARRYRSLRIENALTDQNGDEVKLKKGAHVEVTVAAAGKTPTAKIIANPA